MMRRREFISLLVGTVSSMYFDPPDLDGRMPRVSKWGR
jgi:hypothetical protein